MKFLVLAAALAVVAVPGAAGQAVTRPVLLGYGPAVISPNGNGVHDTLTLHVQASGPVDLRAYVWGGRLHGWREIRTGVSGTGTLRWTPSALGDGSYVVTVCYADRGRRLAPVIPRAEQRPGAAEDTVSRPPWRYSGCLAEPKVVRVERLAAYVDSTHSFEPGSRPPLLVSADGGHATVALADDCLAHRMVGRALPRGYISGLYHYDVGDPTGDEFRAPVVLRNGAFPVDHPPPHTALVVWPYLTWRAYNSYDADLNGIPDSWYHFWRNRRVSLRGAIVPGGQEDDYKAALPFSQWLCERRPRIQSVTDVELGRLPLSVLRRYRAVVFPGHSEYYEPHTWKLLRDYRDRGGHLAFLQANPVLPPGEARQGPQRHGHDRLRCARPRVLRLRARGSRLRRLLLPEVARGAVRLGHRARPTRGSAGSFAGPGSGPARRSATRAPRATGSTPSSRRPVASSRPRRSSPATTAS